MSGFYQKNSEVESLGSFWKNFVSASIKPLYRWQERWVKEEKGKNIILKNNERKEGRNRRCGTTSCQWISAKVKERDRLGRDPWWTGRVDSGIFGVNFDERTFFVTVKGKIWHSTIWSLVFLFLFIFFFNQPY